MESPRRSFVDPCSIFKVIAKWTTVWKENSLSHREVNSVSYDNIQVYILYYYTCKSLRTWKAKYIKLSGYTVVNPVLFQREGDSLFF